MPKITPASFTPDLVIMMRRALDIAAEQLPKSSRTPATKAKMAQRIVWSAAEGITDTQELVVVAARATMMLRDATASPGHGFSFASDHKSVDILRLRNKLNRIVHINLEPPGMSRAKTHKLVFRQIDGGKSERDLRSRSNADAQQKKGF